MTSTRIAQTNHQQNSEKPQASGILQRAAVRSVSDVEVQSTEDKEAQPFTNSAFSKDFSRVPISTTKPQPIMAKQMVSPVMQQVNPPASARLNESETVQQQEMSEASGMQKENKTGLPDNLKFGIENLSGISMYDVKVHYNSPKPYQIGAFAYTQGTDIHVGPGQQRHLWHEAWHVVQQKQRRVKPTLQAKGIAINDDSRLEKEANIMGEKAEKHGVAVKKVRPNPVYARTLIGRNEINVRNEKKGRGSDKDKSLAEPESNTRSTDVIQMMRVVRWMNTENSNDYISKLAAKDSKKYKIMYEELIKNGRKKIVEALDLHGQGLMDTNSPFISVAVNPHSLSWGADTSESGVDEILKKAPHNVWFDVPDQLLYPGMTELSQSETELLVLLPPEKTMKEYIATKSEGGESKQLTEENRWKGLSTEQRRQILKDENLQFTKLVVRETKANEPGIFHSKQEEVPPPWVQGQKERELLVQDLPKEVLNEVIDWVASNHPIGKQKFKEGLRKQEEWATKYLQEQVSKEQEAIRKKFHLK